MRTLTADTKIKVIRPRTLTRDTKIRLSQIKDLTQDKHSKYQNGDIAEWKDGPHKKTPHGWVKVSQKNYSQSVGFNRNEKNLEQNRNRLKKQVVAKVTPGIIAGTTPNEMRKNSKNWIEKNIAGEYRTEIGNVFIEPTAADAMFNHGNKNNFRNKADAIPVIKEVITRGVYLGTSKDYINPTEKEYYFFAAKAKIGTKEQYVFCRVKKSKGDKKSPRLYFHDVFTSDDVLKNGGIPQSGTDQNGQKLTGTPLYKSLLYNFLYSK